MRNKLLELLKAKFEGVSDTILARIADKLAKTATTENEVNTAVEGLTFAQVLESYGDSRATEAQQTAVANYEKKYRLKDGKKNEQKGGAGEGEPKKETKDESEKDGKDDMPAWAKSLIDSNKVLAGKLHK